MKNWLYVPFLILMAVTYIRAVENFSEPPMKQVSRGPASFEVIIQEECIDLPTRFNPHSISKQCD